MSGEHRDPITGKVAPNWYHGNKIMENGKPVKCPKCGSTNVEPVLNFDYIKQCNDCGREFISNEHN